MVLCSIAPAYHCAAELVHCWYSVGFAVYADASYDPENGVRLRFVALSTFRTSATLVFTTAISTALVSNPMAVVGPFLGIVEDFTYLHGRECAVDGFVRLQPKPAFVEKLVTAISTALDSGQLYPGDARSLQGKLLHFSNCIEGRVARGQMFAFREFLELGVTELPISLRRNLEFHLQLINLRPWRTITTTYGMRPRFTIYTDASFDSDHGVRLCFVVLSDSFQTAGISSFTMAILDSMEDKETYIAHGEAFAPLLCLHWLGERLRGSNILWFLDNLGIVSCLCKGSSTVADVGCIIHAFFLKSAALGIQAWYEHVDSKANISDGGTRGDAMVLGMPFIQYPMPQWPKHTLQAGPATWFKWFSEYRDPS